MATKLGKSLSQLLVDFQQSAKIGEKITIEKQEIKDIQNNPVEYIAVIHSDENGLVKDEHKMWLRDMSDHYLPIFSRVNIDEVTKQYFERFYAKKISKQELKHALGITEERFKFLDREYCTEPDRLLIVQQRKPVKRTFRQASRRSRSGRRRWKSLTSRAKANLLPW